MNLLLQKPEAAPQPREVNTDRSLQATLFVEGARLSPGQESILVALDYLGATPGEPQIGRTTFEIATQAGMSTHVTRARLVDLRRKGFIESGMCPQFNGKAADAGVSQYAHYLTPIGYRRSWWAVASRQHDDGLINGQEQRLLAWLYHEAGVPTDRLSQSPEVLAHIGHTFRDKTGHTMGDAALLRHMITSRKRGLWPRVGRGLRGSFKDAGSLSDDQKEILLDVYAKLAMPSDELLTSVRHARILAGAFADASGERKPARVLLHTLMTVRKAGQLPTLRQ